MKKLKEKLWIVMHDASTFHTISTEDDNYNNELQVKGGKVLHSIYTHTYRINLFTCLTAAELFNTVGRRELSAH